MCAGSETVVLKEFWEFLHRVKENNSSKPGMYDW